MNRAKVLAGGSGRRRRLSRRRPAPRRWCERNLSLVVDGGEIVVERLSTVDHSARESMKDAAKCEK